MQKEVAVLVNSPVSNLFQIYSLASIATMPSLKSRKDCSDGSSGSRLTPDWDYLYVYNLRIFAALELLGCEKNSSFGFALIHLMKSSPS
jgi:hypothetical protein